VIEERLGMPLIVKPTRQGSALGVKVVASQAEVPAAMVSAFSYDDGCCWSVRRGRELAVSVLGSEALPIVEAIPHESDVFDSSRYEIGRTRFVCPAELTAEDSIAVTETALRAYEALGCSGFSRVDVMLGAGGPEVLEVNAIPGLTDTSLLPQAAEAAGMEFEQLVERILELALQRAAAAVSP